MSGVVEMESGQAPPAKDPTFSVIHQEVELDIDFTNRTITGWTELSIGPQSRDLRVIKLCSRGCVVKKITAENKFLIDPALLSYRDPFAGLRVRDTYGPEQHGLIRSNIEFALQDPAEPNLVIELPKQVRVRQVDSFGTTLTRSNTKIDGALATPVPKTAGNDDGEVTFTTILLRIEFTVPDTRHALHWVGLHNGDERYPQVYTTASSVPGLPSSFVFPCVGTPSSRCSWRLTLQIPRTLGDIGKRPPKSVQTNGTKSNGVLSNGKGSHDVEMPDVDSMVEDNSFASTLVAQEKERELIVVATGFMEDSDAPGASGPDKRKWIFHCETTVAAHHVGFAIAPFERVNLGEFRENESEDLLKQRAVSIHGFCLPGRTAELRNICMPLTMAIDNTCLKYSPYPFQSASLSHKMCFVDDLRSDVIDYATLSLCSTRHLIPEDIIDKVYESSRILIRAIMSQWVGISVTSKTPYDYWIIPGVSYLMADMFMMTLWGKNEYMYRQRLAATKVAETDVGRPSLFDLGGALGVDRAEIEFLELKAPLVLFIMHQRLVKKSGHNGVPKAIFRMLQDAKYGRLIDGEIDTNRFLYTMEKVAHIKLFSFFEQWIFGAGVPTLQITQKFNKKRMVVEMSITQKPGQAIEALAPDGQKLTANNVMIEAKEQEQEVYASQVHSVFTGPITIRVHEADGTPYEHIADIEKSLTKFDIPYNTKYKRLKRSKLQKERQAASDGAAVTDEGEGDVLTYCLGDGLQSETEMREWRLVDWTKDEEREMSNESYEWLRIDKDFEWICNMELVQPIHMYVSQLQQDNDVAAQMQSVEWLSSQIPTALISTVLTRTVMDDRYFHGVRTMAVSALANCATPQLGFIGQFHLLKIFQTLFCLEGSPMTRTNDFSDQRLYHIQRAIPNALARIKDERGKAPDEIKRFFLDKLKFNDNSGNEFSDDYYIKDLLLCLAESMVRPVGTMNFEFQDLAEEAAETEFNREALNEIERHRRIDEWIPSHRNLFTRAALFCQKRLIEGKVAPRRLAEFMHYLRPGNLDEVRLNAFQSLIELGMLRKDAFLRFAFHLFHTERSPYMRDQFWGLIERGFGLLAFAESSAPPETVTNGLTIAEGESAEVRQERAERTQTIEGALKSLKRKVGQNAALKEALMDALRSPIIGLKEFRELLITCSLLYVPVESLLITLKYPRYLKVTHKGHGKLVFGKSHLPRLKKLADILPKAPKRQRQVSVPRSESPDVKRRRTSITITQKDAQKIKLKTNSHAVQKTPFLKLKGASPSVQKISTPVTFRPEHAQSSLPSPAASQPKSVSKVPDRCVASPMSAPRPIASRRVILKFTTDQGKARFAAIVSQFATPVSSLLLPASLLDLAVQPPQSVKVEPPPSRPLSAVPKAISPTASTLPNSSNSIPGPRAPMKLKLKFGGKK